MQVVNPTPAAIYSGIGNAIATISRVEGYMSLWRGLSSVVLGAGMFEMPENMNLRTNGGLTPAQDPHTQFTLQRMSL